MTRRTKSNINYEYLAIVDERSTRDSTAVLVAGNIEGNGIESVRAVFEVVTLTLSVLSIGHGMMSENQEQAAAEPDGVFRIHPQPKAIPKQHKAAPRKFLGRPE